MKLFHNPDGANQQARAVLALLQSQNIDKAYSTERHGYAYGDFDNEGPQVDRWHNCREQGYVIHWQLKDEQLNIAFFEHRNSDSICAVMWKQRTMNAPTIETMDTKGTVYKDKYDTSRDVSPGQYDDMVEWIMEQLTAFYLKHKS